MKKANIQNIESELTALHLRVVEYAYNHSIPELLRKILDEAENITGSEIGFFHFVSEDLEEVKLQVWSTNTSEIMCALKEPLVHYPIAEAGVWIDCIHQRKAVFHNDFANLANKKGYPKGHTPITRELLIPIIRNKKILAIVGLGNKKSDYIREDAERIQRIVDSAWETIERKQAEEALLESERRLSTLMDNLPGMVFRCLNDQNWTMKFTSSGCRKLTGYMSTDLLENKNIAFSELIHPDDRSRVWLSIQKELEGKRSYEIEYRIITTGGNQKYVLESGTGIFEGDQVKYLEGFISDITLRKQAELKIQKDQDHLEELVQERTRDIEEKNKELERLNKLFVGREFRIKELREKVNELEKKLQAK